jgi:phosphatidylglycerophosphatase A
MSGNGPSARELAFGTPAGFLAFGFGSGLSPFAPGTAGTLAAIPFAIGLMLLPTAAYWVILLLLLLAGVRLCDITASRLGQHDPGSIVWDEMVGYWLAIAFIPLHWAWLAAAFVAFRVFDIFKPWPIRWAEKRFGGGAGIMFDDIVAAVYAILSLEILAFIIETV